MLLARHAIRHACRRAQNPHHPILQPLGQSWKQASNQALHGLSSNHLPATSAPCPAAHPPQILAGAEAGQQLLMNDRYFFSLLERMLGDVSRQPEGEQRAQLLAKLQAVQVDAAAAAERAGAA